MPTIAERIEKYCGACGQVKPIEMFKPRYKNVRGVKKRKGWHSRCRACLHVVERARAKKKRKQKAIINYVVRVRSGKHTSSGHKIKRANQLGRMPTRTCNYCGETYANIQRNFASSRICNDCAPFKGITGFGKFRAWVQKIMATEDTKLLAKLRKIVDEKDKTIRISGEKVFVPAALVLDFVEKQKFRCAICGRKPNGLKMCIDHDHQTLQVRGILCHNCNIGIGALGDNMSIVLNAFNYLKQNFEQA